jgi:hypothetical protein
VTLNIKRDVTIQVVVTDTFKTHYIGLMNKLIDAIQVETDQLQRVLDTIENKSEFYHYVQEKLNAQLLQQEQCKQQIEKVKQSAIGDSFVVSKTEGFIPLQEGDDLIKTLLPVVVQAEDNAISSILSF